MFFSNLASRLYGFLLEHCPSLVPLPSSLAQTTYAHHTPRRLRRATSSYLLLFLYTLLHLRADSSTIVYMGKSKKRTQSEEKTKITIIFAVRVRHHEPHNRSTSHSSYCCTDIGLFILVVHKEIRLSII